MCNVSSVGRHAKEAYAATIEAYPSLKDRAWCGSKTWNKVKQEFFCYWHPSFNVPFHLWDVKAMVGVFELIHSIPKRFWASNKVGFFGSSYGYACSLVLWLILSLETNGPLNKQVQHENQYRRFFGSLFVFLVERPKHCIHPDWLYN